MWKCVYGYTINKMYKFSMKSILYFNSYIR